MLCDLRLEEEKKIENRFGLVFLQKIKHLLIPLSLNWELSDLQLVNSFSSNLVFKGHSKKFGRIVLKFSNNTEEFISEVTALDYFQGNSVCRVFDMDTDNLVLLEECICPGEILALEKDLNKRLDVFCDLYQSIHMKKDIAIQKSGKITSLAGYKSYQDWVFQIEAYMVQQDVWQEVAIHMSRAKVQYIEMAQNHAANQLLHGDFHYYNILKGEYGYKIIDPKGVIGNRIFDVPRYVLNEIWDVEDEGMINQKIDQIFDVLSRKLSISKDILSMALYIEGVMAVSWCVEDGAGLHEKENYLNKIENLERFIQKYSE